MQAGADSAVRYSSGTEPLKFTFSGGFVTSSGETAYSSIAEEVLITGQTKTKSSIRLFEPDCRSKWFSASIDGLTGNSKNTRVIAFPLRGLDTGRTIGVLQFVFSRNSKYAKSDFFAPGIVELEPFGAIYAELIGPVLAQSIVFQRISSHVEMLGSLLNASSSMYSIIPNHGSFLSQRLLQVEEILHMMESICRVTLKCSRCRAYLMSSRVGVGGDFLIVLDEEVGSGGLSRDTKDMTSKQLPANQGIAGRVLKTKIGHLVEDILTDKFFDSSIDLDPESWPLFVVPITDLEGDVMACVELVGSEQSPRLRSGYDGGDGRILFDIAAQWLAHQISGPLQHLLRLLHRTTASRPVTPSARLSPRMSGARNLPFYAPCGSFRGKFSREKEIPSGSNLDINVNGSMGSISTSVIKDFGGGVREKNGAASLDEFQLMKIKLSQLQSELNLIRTNCSSYDPSEKESLTASIFSLESELKGLERDQSLKAQVRSECILSLQSLIHTTQNSNKSLEFEVEVVKRRLKDLSSMKNSEMTTLGTAQTENLEKIYMKKLFEEEQNVAVSLTELLQKISLIEVENSELESVQNDNAARENLERENEAVIVRLKALTSNDPTQQKASLQKSQEALEQKLESSKKVAADKEVEVATLTVALQSTYKDNLLLSENISALERRIGELELADMKKETVLGIMQEQIVKMANDQSKSYEEMLKKGKDSTHAEPSHKEWQQHYDDQGNLYYYNNCTGETSWEPPTISAAVSSSSSSMAQRSPPPFGGIVNAASLRKGDWVSRRAVIKIL